jgi:peptidoglycan lytic transglycosylase B
VRGFPPTSLAALLAALALWLMPAAADEGQPSFAEWLDGVRAEALASGIPDGIVALAFDGLELDPRVIDLTSRQAEFTDSFYGYTAKRVSPTRIAAGRAMMATYKPELDAVAKAYGVQSRFIVAIWGLETNYGGQTGGYDVVRSLATLAFASAAESRRDYFRRELLTSLRILKEGHVDRAKLQGSWAGAMGQGQFMPSSFFSFAQDFDADGRIDIWGTPADVFASIANYLKAHGWRDDLTWGRQVKPPANFAATEPTLAGEGGKGCAAENKLSKSQKLSEWEAMGFRRLDGQPLPAREVDAALVLPAGDGGPAFLVYGNYVPLLRYNCSTLYALSIGLLADKVAR